MWVHSNCIKNYIEGYVMSKELTEKLEKIVELLNNVMVDPDIDLEYCSTEAVPYILVKYSEDKYIERKIRLTDKYLKNSAEEIANLVTFSIEQFKAEVDSVHMS